MNKFPFTIDQLFKMSHIYIDNRDYHTGTDSINDKHESNRNEFINNKYDLIRRTVKFMIEDLSLETFPCVDKVEEIKDYESWIIKGSGSYTYNFKSRVFCNTRGFKNPVKNDYKRDLFTGLEHFYELVKNKKLI